MKSQNSKQLLSIGLSVFLLYFWSVNFPFIFDDYPSIVNNPDIKNRDAFLRLDYLLNLFRRPITHFSFYINYLIGELNPIGYRVFNVLIHIANSFLVFFIVKTLINKESNITKSNFAFITALIFAAHPVMTHGVTYIVQRMTSLSSFFYLLAILSFIQFRVTKLQGSPKFIRLTLVFLFGLLSLFSKQIGITLPLALLFIELIYFKQKKVILSLISVITVGLFIGLIYLVYAPANFIHTGIENVSRLNYFFTQIHVSWNYLIWLIYPFDITLDPKIAWLNGPSFRGVIFLCLLVLVTLLSFKSFKKGNNLFVFGLAWILITCLVEFTFIPIHDAMAAHRLYLPMLGISIISTQFLAKNKWLMAFALLYLFSGTAYKNALFGNEEALWVQNIEKYPNNGRPYNNLAQIYLNWGDTVKADSLLRIALVNDSNYYRTYTNLGQLYLQSGQDEKAVELFGKAIFLNSRDALAHNNLGVAWRNLKVESEALKYFNLATRLDPNLALAHYNRAVILEKIGRPEDALISYKNALKINENYEEALFNVGNYYLKSNFYVEAIDYYKRLALISEYNHRNYNNMGIAYFQLGELEQSLAAFKKAVKLAPNNSEYQQNILFIMDKISD